MIRRNSTSSLEIKLIDFNIALPMLCQKTGEKRVFFEKTGQLWGRAPEMIQDSFEGYDERVDLWGAAVCFYYALTGQAPF